MCLQFQVNSLVENLVQMEILFHSGGPMRAHHFHLMPLESVELRVAARTLPAGRIVTSSSVSTNEVWNKSIDSLSYEYFPNGSTTSSPSSSSGTLSSAKNSSPVVDKLPHMFGPVLLGTLKLEPMLDNGTKSDSTISSNSPSPSPSTSGKYARESETFRDMAADVTIIDIVGYLVAGPTVCVSVKDDSNQFHLVTASSEVLGSSSSSICGPELVVENNCVEVVVMNDKYHSQTLEFLSCPFRHAGLNVRLPFPLPESSVKHDDFGVFDTVKTQMSQQKMFLHPNEQQSVKLTLRPSSPTKTIQDVKALSFSEDIASLKEKEKVLEDKFVVGRLPIEIFDTEYPLHLPGFLALPLTSSLTVPAVVALPVIDSSRRKRQQGTSEPPQRAILKSDSTSVIYSSLSASSTGLPLPPPPPVFLVGDAGILTPPTALNHSSVACVLNEEVRDDLKPAITTTASAESLRNQVDADANVSCLSLRGVARTSASTFEINLGQQIHRNEFVEWVITLENSTRRPLFFSADILSGASFVALNNSRGCVPSSGSTALLLYISRACMGVFSGVILLQNCTNPLQDVLAVSVNVEVVLSDPQRRPFPLPPAHSSSQLIDSSSSVSTFNSSAEPESNFLLSHSPENVLPHISPHDSSA